MKKVLLINYSQTGQLHQIMNNLSLGLANVEIDQVKVEMKTSFDFPWTGKKFFDAMPESVLEVPTEIEESNFKHSKYDLIVLGYQPWFLSPSIPTNSLLNNKTFGEIIKGTPVVTVIGARNMWISSQESMKQQIAGLGGKLVGNIPFIDRNNNYLSAVSILHWMMKGEKTKPYGIFPKPGISDEDIASATQTGKILSDKLHSQELDKLQEEYIKQGFVYIKTSIMFVESRAKILFRAWANAIIKKGKTPAKRERYLLFFKYYLLIALFIIAPIVLIVYLVLVRPFTIKSIKRKKAYFSGVLRRNE